MNTLQLLKKIDELANNYDCADSFDESTLKTKEGKNAFDIHKETCVHCRARQLINSIADDLFGFNREFHIAEE